MFTGLRHFLAPSAEPLPPGPRGRILFIGPFNGGVGGLERITKCFAEWARDSGYTTTMVVLHDLPGAYHVQESETLRIVPESAWGSALAKAEYDFVYVVGAGLKRRRWLPRLARMRGVRVMLDLDRKRKWIDVTDVLHCEAPRAGVLPRPHVVAMPDPYSTMPAVEAKPAGDYYLTAFNPYGGIKGHQYIERFCEATDKRLVWCYDLTTWLGREGRYRTACQANIDSVKHERLELVEAPSRERLYELYAGCAGYVCFSEDESFGFSMLDAVALGKPLCAREVGICRALAGFRPTEDFARPVFGTYALPETLGYGALFDAVPGVLQA